MTPDETVTVKGSPVRSLQKFIEADLSAEQKQALYAALPPEPAARFRAPILPTETIPVHLLNRVTEEAARIKGEPLEQFARRAGREAAGDAVRGIYRFFAMVLTPAALLSKAGNMWSSIYNVGELRVSNQTETSARISLVKFPSELAGCLRFTGWIEKMAELTGAKDVKIEKTKCFSRGAEHCEWELRWR
jgi:eukaryotic-like serine/threonine-protein kinase